MDLIAIHPIFNMYNYDWPIYTSYGASYPPAKFVHNDTGRLGEAINSAVSPGAVISGARVQGSVISPRVHIHSYAQVNDSVIMDSVTVGRQTVVERAILDKDVVVLDGAMIGVDHARDLERGFTVSEGGVVVVPKGVHVVP